MREIVMCHVGDTVTYRTNVRRKAPVDTGMLLYPGDDGEEVVVRDSEGKLRHVRAQMIVEAVDLAGNPRPTVEAHAR